jgi:hypothetical protein
MSHSDLASFPLENSSVNTPSRLIRLIPPTSQMITVSEKWDSREGKSCGCRLKVKARWRSESCPLWKWPAS